MLNLSSNQKRTISQALAFYLAGYNARRGDIEASHLLDVRWEDGAEPDPKEIARLLKRFDAR